MQKINKKYFNILIIFSIIFLTALMHYIFYYKFKNKQTIFESFDSDKKNGENSQSPTAKSAGRRHNDFGVVYFAFLKEDRWRTIVLPQMQDLVDCKLAENADIDIVLSGTEEEIVSAKSEIMNILSQVNSNVQFSYSYENTYEYPGIAKLYEKANEDPEKIYLYFHSKGMVFYGEAKRNKIEIYLFEKIIKNWENILDIFEKNPDKNKVTLGCSMEGFCWFNFFWVRGSYLKNNCTPPIITDNRYYYESYITSDCKNATYEDCYNLADNNEKPYYIQSDIAKYVHDQELLE